MFTNKIARVQLCNNTTEHIYFHLQKEAIFMIITETWWETIFSGVLAIGIDEKKLSQLEDESFLYFKEQLPEAQTENES